MTTTKKETIIFETMDEEQKIIHYEKMGFDGENGKRSVKCLREWLVQNPHLPQTCSDQFLETILTNRYNRIEEAKQKIDNYFSLRSVYEDYLMPCDPTNQELRRKFKVAPICMLPGLTLEGYRVCIISILDKDIDKFDICSSLKYMCMMYEVMAIEGGYDCGIITIYDCSKFTMKHLASFTPTAIRAISANITKMLPNRFKAGICINANSYVEILINSIKVLLPEKLRKRFFIYQGGNENLSKHISSLNMLPKEYGGNEDTLQEVIERWNNKLEDYRQWFTNDVNVKCDETKRPPKTSGSQDVFGTEGTFKKLSVD